MASPALVVYIVDDDAAIRQALTRLMRSAGLPVEAFASVQALMDKAPFAPRACVVADIRMPGRSGLELPELLSRQHHHLPVIFITAYDTDEHRQAARAAGAAAFFRKPVDGEALLDAITWAVESAVDGAGAGCSSQTGAPQGSQPDSDPASEPFMPDRTKAT